VRTGQIGALPEMSRCRPRFSGSMVPRIVMAWGMTTWRRSAWASTSATTPLIVSATATHPQAQDTAHGAAMIADASAYTCRRGIWRRRATRRRSCRAANRATVRRATQITRSIMIIGRTAHAVPATHSVVFLELSGPRRLVAEDGPSHHGLRDDISRQGES
jgi:hypothetical protein